jgi:uncharacterized protein (DUF2062 family)
MECLTNGELDRHPFARIVAFGDVCDESRHDHLVKQWQQAKLSQPWHPCLRPREPINLRALPALGALVMGVENSGRRKRRASTSGG